MAHIEPSTTGRVIVCKEYEFQSAVTYCELLAKLGVERFAFIDTHFSFIFTEGLRRELIGQNPTGARTAPKRSKKR